MSGFGSHLKKIRQVLDFSSARAFFLHLSDVGEVEFNYAYYKKVENGERFPSPKFLHSLLPLIPERNREELVLAYSREQFPQYDHLFKAKEKVINVPKQDRAKQAKTGMSIGQKELSERQVAAISKERENYFFFSLLTLSRFPLKINALKEYFPDQLYEDIYKDLSEVNLIRIEDDSIVSAYPEFTFPRPESKSLKAAYLKLDEYDLEKVDFFGLDKVKKGAFFRRISPRYVTLIAQNIDLLFQTIRMSDESDIEQNNQVISLSLRLDSGELPG